MNILDEFAEMSASSLSASVFIGEFIGNTAAEAFRSLRKL